MDRSRLGIGDPTISWLRAAYRAMAAMRELEFGFDFMTPLLFVLAGADTLVSSPAANALAERTRGAAAVHILDSRHEILMERDALRDQFWAAFDAFLPGERPYIPPLASAAEQF